jgi:hypothetical protein
MSNHLNPKVIFTILFIIINLIACFMMVNTGMLIGDVNGFPVQNITNIYLATALVLITYLFVLYFLYYFFSRVKIRKIYFRNTDKDFKLGLVILILQILFLFFNLINGVNVSGKGNSTTNSIFSIFWVFISADFLFIIYYGFYRDTHFFRYNLVVAVLSSVLRGRADIFLWLIYMEMSKLYIEKKISIKKIALFSSVVLFLYPLIVVIKFAFRFYYGVGEQDFSSYFLEIFNESQSGGVILSLTNGLEHIIGRLQIVSIAAEIHEFSSELAVLYDRNYFYPFWKEGLHGIIWDAVMGNSRGIPLGVAFTEVGNFSWVFNSGDWVTNPGIAGWILFSPIHTPLLILYISILCFVSLYFAEKIGAGKLSKSMIWFSWLVYLLPGWFGTYITFVISLFVFLIFKIAIYGKRDA